ncbi:hypothetical protein GLAREA_09415 [Glarea lozoyensis ATCC 20868]|uniref:Uncharacterized protein n=2 Tax=Glarea lozoyensis TaxID=101852 RepID=S3CRM5_GLAL2|nr:uncharacterized protein GLAREA_09415 [Glarea lozoyensis ATCC 20868]EHK98674.1 hypothetical protein M7I_5513 [Glarea lozoyensis 74030]EPE28295.1 hypothetical protein GLAREA_09415 [Glarea lozoyensis ATCC 20868]
MAYDGDTDQEELDYTKKNNLVKHLICCHTAEDIEPAIKFAEEQGGKYPKKRPIMTGFTIKFPKDSVSVLSDSKHVSSAEIDGEVKTQ